MFYLDNAATTPTLPAVLEKGLPYLKEDFGNPSSLHNMGMTANRAVKSSRQVFSSIFHVPQDQVVFCGSGTEANHLALMGTAYSDQLKGKQLIVSGIEHPGVIRNIEFLESQGFHVDRVRTLAEGILDLAHLESLLSEDTRLVSCMMINNEIGTKQPITAMGNLIKQKNPKTIFHVDAVQAFTKVDLELKAGKVDLVSVSGHKIGGPKGVGALINCGRTPIAPVILGGGQEHGQRSGTENVFGIVALGEAARLGEEKREATLKGLETYRDQWIQFLKERCPKVEVFQSPHVVPYFLNVSLPPIPAEVFLHHLEAEDIYVSTGSACSSKKTQVSHVLDEVMLDNNLAKSMIRLSFSEASLNEDQDELFRRFQRAVEQLLSLF